MYVCMHVYLCMCVCVCSGGLQWDVTWLRRCWCMMRHLLKEPAAQHIISTYRYKYIKHNLPALILIDYSWARCLHSVWMSLSGSHPRWQTWVCPVTSSLWVLMRHISSSLCGRTYLETSNQVRGETRHTTGTPRIIHGIYITCKILSTSNTISIFYIGFNLFK